MEQANSLIQRTLNNLVYDLEYLKRFEGKPCWITFEFKYYTLAMGISMLEKMQLLYPDEFRSEIDALLVQYRHAHQTIL